MTAIVHNAIAWLSEELGFFHACESPDGEVWVLAAPRSVGGAHADAHDREEAPVHERASHTSDLSRPDVARVQALPLHLLLSRAVGVPGGAPRIERAISQVRQSLETRASFVESGHRILVFCERGWLHGLAVLPPADAQLAVLPPADAHLAFGGSALAEFAADVAHELANSLTAIAGWTDLAVSGGPLPQRTRRALRVVRRSVSDASQTARDLLRTMREGQRAGRRCEDGKGSAPARGASGAPSSEVSAAPVRAAQVVEDVLETLRPELDQGGIDLDVDVDRSLFVQVAAHDLRLVVSNLVRNAIEALRSASTSGTYPGRVSIRGRRTEPDSLQLTVIDDGPGMTEEQRESAFHRYFTTKEEGTGLGLALVRHTIHEAGGALSVESDLGSGTRFDVRLPLVTEPRSKSRRTMSGYRAKVANLSLRVLVVDDEEALLTMVETALSLVGAEVVAAKSVRDALAAAGRFDLALIDLTLPGGGGDQLIAQLRREHRVGQFVLLTGVAEPDWVPEGAPDVVLRKPFELDELLSLISTLVERRATTSA